MKIPSQLAHVVFEDEEVLLADGFDEAILGVIRRVGQPVVVVYDRDKCVSILRQRDGMSLEDAEEYFEFNVQGVWMGEGTPGFLDRGNLLD